MYRVPSQTAQARALRERIIGFPSQQSRAELLARRIAPVQRLRRLRRSLAEQFERMRVAA